MVCLYTLAIRTVDTNRLRSYPKRIRIEMRVVRRGGMGHGSRILHPRNRCRRLLHLWATAPCSTQGKGSAARVHGGSRLRQRTPRSLGPPQGDSRWESHQRTRRRTLRRRVANGDTRAPRGQRPQKGDDWTGVLPV